MKKFLLLYSLFFCSIHILYAQELTQTVRGTVTDKVSQSPVPGAIVTVVSLDPKKSVVSNDDGVFKLTGVPVGKHTLVMKMTGYQDVVLSNLVVNSGKELVLNISMEESVIEAQEVEVKATVEKNRPLNEMSTVSSRTFSVEETQKYAAAVNDPARMATAFAGVVSAGDGSNYVSIRGNSPNALLWRMEGVEIPNPNHFSNVGTAGGGISILSSQLLSNSDFSTGAFAAEYGNILGGVFDLRLRKGNNEKREYTFQAGILGIDVAAEGPFKKDYGGSYLINYRYSTLGILSKIGVNIGDGVTTFQDLSYNIFFPTKKAGNFSLFGFGGLSSQVTKAVEDSTLWSDDFYRSNSDFRANTGASGITHTLWFNDKTYLKSALVLSGTENSYHEDTLDNAFVAHDRYKEKYLQYKLTFSSLLNVKINNRHSLRSGIIVNRLGYDLSQHELKEEGDTQLTERIQEDGNSYSVQAYTQWQYRATEKITLNAGAHSVFLVLNNTYSVEPRASVRYAFTPAKSISVGYGLHSQVQPLVVYFAKVTNTNGQLEMANKNIGLSKAHHVVLAYDWNFNEYWRFKTEGYYQHLYNIPQGTIAYENFSLLNNWDGYNSRLLNSDGTGRNYGLEFTLERFMNRNFYLLSSTSIYKSEYKATDGNYYNTRYNGNYAFSLTAGKEIEWSGKVRKRSFGFNIKSTYAGGFRQVPINMDSTLATGNVVLDYKHSFEDQMPAYFRTDIRISYKTNFKHMTGTVALDIQNVTNRKNVGGRYFDDKEKQLKYWYQAPLIPILSYRLEF